MAKVCVTGAAGFIGGHLAETLLGEGHEVVGVCDSLVEAFDFALLDIDVVGGKSFEVASHLNERKIPFAFVSASERSELPPDLRNARLIPKPYHESAIVRTLAA